MRRQEIRVKLQELVEQLLEGWRLQWNEPPSGQHQGKGVDYIVEAAAPLRKLKIVVEVKSSPSVASLEVAARHVQEYVRILNADFGLLVAPHLSEQSRNRLRKMGVCFLDLSGNTWIRHDGILIDRVVPKSLYPHQSKSKSPFADKASLILRMLLDEPDCSGRVRQLAEKGNLDPGYVSRMLAVLVERDYAARRKDGAIELIEPEAVILDWVHFYDWRKNEISGYYCPLDRLDAFRESLRGAGEDIALSMHAGANLIEPIASYEPWHAYIANAAFERKLLKRFLKEAGKAGNVFLMRPYYQHSVFWGWRRVRGYPVVSDLQLYLDLYHFPIRGREAAEAIWRKRLSRNLSVHGA